MASWEEMKIIGDDFEMFCVLDMRKKGQPNAFLNVVKENFLFYDIILPDINKFIECKFDKESAKTGNICIEVGCNGRLSGLLITKANYWIISDGIIGYIIKIDEIRKCIAEESNLIYKKEYPVTQQDGVSKDMNFYLIPRNIFEKYCDEINNINSMKYETLK